MSEDFEQIIFTLDRTIKNLMYEADRAKGFNAEFFAEDARMLQEARRLLMKMKNEDTIS